MFIELINTPAGAAIIGAIISGPVCSFITWWLSKSHEQKKEITDTNSALQQEIERLQKKVQIYEATQPSTTGDYLILKNSGQAICPTCWGAAHKLVPIYGNETGHYICGGCKTQGIFDHQKVRKLAQEQEMANRELWDTIDHLYDN